MDRQQANRARALLLGDRLELLHPGGVLLEHEADEALDVGAAQLLVEPGEPRELAQVRVAAPPVPLREHGEVVVVLDEDVLAQPLEPDRARDRGQPVVALPERLEEPRVALGRAVGKPLLEPGEERPLRRSPPDGDEAVVRDADERRGEHGDERLVVVAVVEQAQVAEQVDHLLLAEVPAPGRTVGRQPGGAELLLVLLGVGAGREEEDDLPRLRLARVDELLHAPRDRLRLAAAPGDAGVLVARLVGDEQLDGRARRRIGEAPGGDEALELVAEGRGEQLVDDREHLGPRAPVLR